ncbi:MAG: sterol desaturase family protein [Gammaproteobacteria bacterium]|nr:sterol desaturase family protein [Gammaproteobacteria bacterium]
MTDFLIDHEVALRLGAFFTVFAAMAIWEVVSPRRLLTVSKLMRWGNNLTLVVLNSVILRLIFPLAAVGVATFVESAGWGLLNYYGIPQWIAVVVAIVVMDFVIYLQHVLVHAVPLLWRLHRVHHADMDYDVTTGTRFHPIEIVLSMLIKFSIIVVLGAPVVAVILFEIILNAMAMFNHGNVALPQSADRKLRHWIVTPDMHRVHHSVEDDETNSNFGFNLSCWDRLFGTYRDQPRAGHTAMVIGIYTYRDTKQVQQLPGILLLPFVGHDSEYAINRRQWQDKESDKKPLK